MFERCVLWQNSKALEADPFTQHALCRPPVAPHPPALPGAGPAGPLLRAVPLLPSLNCTAPSLQYETLAGSTLQGTTVCVAEQTVAPSRNVGWVVQFQPVVPGAGEGRVAPGGGGGCLVRSLLVVHQSSFPRAPLLH